MTAVALFNKATGLTDPQSPLAIAIANEFLDASAGLDSDDRVFRINDTAEYLVTDIRRFADALAEAHTS
jgi:hypothetical protein